MNLSEDLNDLEREDDPHRRGKRFETFLAQMLEREGFDVTHNPKSAQPLQTDLMARREQTFFIIEAKWTKKRIDVGVISSVQSRLTRVPADVFACVFSMAGFSDKSVQEVCGKRNQEIILFNGIEIRGIVDGRISFAELLSDKRNELRTNATAFLSEDQIPEAPRSHLRAAPDIFQVGTQHSNWMRSGTNHNDFVFSNELLDCTGRRMDSLFSLELQLRISEIADLERSLNFLQKQLGLSGQGSFAIHQGNVGWFGFGFQTFLSAAKEQKTRYDELKWNSYHHSEELAYLDSLDDGGLMCVSTRQGTGEGDHLHSTRVEIFSPGLPVDNSSIRHLCRVTKNPEAQWEIVRENPFKMLRFHPRVQVEPVATIVSDSDGRRWASGLVVRNPFLKSAVPSDEEDSVAELQRMIPSSEFLFCALRHWHNPNDRMDRYEICSAEGLWIARYYALHIVCDWLQ
jgi:hypothetical protein